MPTSNYKEQIDTLQLVKADLEDVGFDLNDMDTETARLAEASVYEAIQSIEDALTTLKY